MKHNKLVLGTVQFGLDYGINNQRGKVSEKEVSSILNIAVQNGIYILDTSSAYGDSEEVLGRTINENGSEFRIISKHPKSELSVRDSFNKSLTNLDKDSIYGYMIHHFDFYQDNPSIWDEMSELREQGLVEKIGFSLYTTKQLEFLLENNVDFDIVQFPYNIFDRQFEPYLHMLKDRGVEIHTRSVFLQGLFFKPLDSLLDKLKPLLPYLITLYDYCEKSNVNVAELALNYVLNNQYIDGVLMGVDSVDQLRTNIACTVKELVSADIAFVESINIKEKELLNPVNWKL